MEYNEARKIIEELFPRRRNYKSDFDKWENVSNLCMGYNREELGYADREGRKVPYVSISENWSIDHLAAYETNKVRRYTVTRVESACPRINDCYEHTPFPSFQYEDCDSLDGDIILQKTEKDVFRYDEKDKNGKLWRPGHHKRIEIKTWVHPCFEKMFVEERGRQNIKEFLGDSDENSDEEYYY
ncbi:MAG: hypothetical protein U9R34_08080 [Nanoarchaeota archaeon]|nr:hypothetical protein [Nanoarchaeota archaeon]